MADTQSRPVVPRKDQDDELCHQVCCEDNDKALCGRDVSQATWRPKEAETFDCVVCDDLNREVRCPLHVFCRRLPLP